MLIYLNIRDALRNKNIEIKQAHQALKSVKVYVICDSMKGSQISK